MILRRGRMGAASSPFPVVRRAGGVIALILVLSACGGDNQEATAVPDDFAVTLQRTVCFGPCPVYTASVDASGQVQYDGTRCVAVYGHQESRLSHRRLRALMAAFEDIDFYALQDEYRSDEGSCEPGAFDGTIVIISRRSE